MLEYFSQINTDYDYGKYCMAICCKFISIMATNSKMFLLKLSKFIKSANTLRSQTLEDLAIS